jgi:flagellar basal-body rod protein FlgB
MGLIQQRLSYLSQRQAVLAQNVANANSPGYTPKDLGPFSFAQAMRETKPASAVPASSLNVTNATHIQAVAAGSAPIGTGFASKKMKAYEVLPSGNAVTLEQQMSLVSQTAIEYNAYTGIMGRVRGWLRMALGRQGS